MLWLKFPRMNKACAVCTLLSRQAQQGCARTRELPQPRSPNSQVKGMVVTCLKLDSQNLEVITWTVLTNPNPNPNTNPKPNTNPNPNSNLTNTLTLTLVLTRF